MLKKIPFIVLSLIVGSSCSLFACSDENNCDDVQIGVCEGTLLVTGCSLGKTYGYECKDISETALCGMINGSASCYEPCTKEGEEKDICIDHSLDTDYCELKSISGECAEIPPHQRPNTYKHSICELDSQSGILYRHDGSENDCYRSSSSTCCLEAGRLCSAGFGATCDESTNTAVFCSDNESLVVRKNCSDEGGLKCDSGQCISE